jgi:hypothetical protein
MRNLPFYCFYGRRSSRTMGPRDLEYLERVAFSTYFSSTPPGLNGPSSARAVAVTATVAAVVQHSKSLFPISFNVHLRSQIKLNDSEVNKAMGVIIQVAPTHNNLKTKTGKWGHPSPCKYLYHNTCSQPCEARLHNVHKPSPDLVPAPH